MNKLYSIFPWPEDPEFHERGETSLKLAEKTLQHKFLANLLEHRALIKIADICSGTGLGGYVFSKLLLEKGYKIQLTLIDIRAQALTKGAQWITRELGIKLETHTLDATTIHTLNKTFDLAIIWGSSTPHFNPWTMNKLLASTTNTLAEDGVLILQESDRLYHIVHGGYRHINVVEGKDKTILDVYAGYNPLKGTCERIVVDLGDPRRNTYMELYYWSIAALGALLWLFFKDVDILETRMRSIYVLVATKPRKTITPKQLEQQPTILEKIKGKTNIPS